MTPDPATCKTTVGELAGAEDAEWREMVNAFVQDNLGSNDLSFGFLMGALSKLHVCGRELEQLRARVADPGRARLRELLAAPVRPHEYGGGRYVVSTLMWVVLVAAVWLTLAVAVALVVGKTIRRGDRQVSPPWVVD